MGCASHAINSPPSVEPCFGWACSFTQATQTATSLSSRRSRFRCSTRGRLLPLRPSLRGHRTAYKVAARSSDPFVAAGSRLQNLLSGVGDGEEEVLESLLSEQAPESKVGLSLLAAGVISTGALALCWVTGSDPWGGASLSFHSLTAATLGAAACVPLLMLRARMWSSEACSQFPVLEELQTWQAEVSTPIVKNMTNAQIAVLVCCEALPSTLMTLPAAQGGLTTSFQIYANHLREWGVSVPVVGPAIAALAVTALLAACARLFERAISQEEHDIVVTAMDNADRYYRVMSNGVNATAKDPEDAAKAFKAVASQWLQQRQQACTLLAVVTAGEVIFMGLLWRLTDDMAAPMAAATMMTAVEYAFVKKLVDPGTKPN